MKEIDANGSVITPKLGRELTSYLPSLDGMEVFMNVEQRIKWEMMGLSILNIKEEMQIPIRIRAHTFGGMRIQESLDFPVNCIEVRASDGTCLGRIINLKSSTFSEVKIRVRKVKVNEKNR